ncbi:hypothetical protein CRENBAI_002907 [Crenichthys baileyi]|uniref:Uncharacterized protein n=1 Tax=Crenichthys baileyi TaxID=28760 RepID=A0AAV9S8M0_9TELE
MKAKVGCKRRVRPYHMKQQDMGEVRVAHRNCRIAPAETTGQLAEKERSSQKGLPVEIHRRGGPPVIPPSPQTPTQTAQNSPISPLKGALKIGTQMTLTSSPFNTPRGRGPATEPTSSKSRRAPPPPNLSPSNQDLTSL